jgi:hypothetical protein
MTRYPGVRSLIPNSVPANKHLVSPMLGACKKGLKMTPVTTLLVTILIAALSAPSAWAACNISDGKLEEAILKKPEFRDPENRQMVQDLRRLRDSAFILWSYGQTDACEQLLGHIRELVAAPSMGSLGGSDEDEVEQQIAAGEPMVQKGGAVIGNRNNIDAAPLTKFAEMVPLMRADEIMGAEVRTSDDEIVGEVRNIIIGTEGRRDYAIVATGGFFVPGKDSIVVSLRYLRVSRERSSFYLALTKTDLAAVPLMPNNNYEWLSDEAWLARNNLLFSVEPKQDKWQE